MASTLKTEARKLIDLREARDKTKLADDKAKEKLDAQQVRVHKMMEDAGFKTTSIDLGEDYGEVALGRRVKTFARVFDKEKLKAALESENRDGEIMKFEFHKAPLNEMVKERRETGQKMPEGLDFSETRYVQITKKKGKK